MYDRFFRKIDYLRLSITDRCNLFCKYCRAKEGCEVSGHELKKEDIFKIISAFRKLGIKKLRLTGGEPFVRNDIFEIIKFSYDLGIENINVTTNGVLNEDKIQKIIESNLNSINISLDTLDRQKYKEVIAVDALERVINAIEKLSKFKRVKINTVLMRSINLEEINELILFAKKNNVVIRFIELMPIGVANEIFEREFISIDDVLRRFKGYRGVDSITKSVARYYYIEDFDYVVGFINAVSGCFCGDCNKVRVSSQGILYNCLFDENGLDLKDYMQSEDILIEKIKEFVMEKKYMRLSRSDSMMFKIGG